MCSSPGEDCSRHNQKLCGSLHQREQHSAKHVRLFVLLRGESLSFVYSMLMNLAETDSCQDQESFLPELRCPVDEEGKRAGVFIGNGIEQEALAIGASVIINHALAIGAEGRMERK
jgi:hypothetical protein